MNERLMQRLRKKDFEHINIKEDIKYHLEEILNTKKGSALIREDYGMDTALINEENDLEKIKTTLKILIEEFEPRIKIIRINIIESSNCGEEDEKKGKEIFINRKFEIVATVGENKMSFESTLSAFPSIEDDFDNFYKKWKME